MLKRAKQEKIRMFSVPQNCVTFGNWRVDKELATVSWTTI
jgi:hypothetical protein